MSPVKQSSGRNPRTVLIGIGGIALGIIAVLVLFVVAIPKLTESGTVKVQLGTSQFGVGSAESRSETIRRDGPILFPDVAGRSQDIYLQHTGATVPEGWLAFDARQPGAGRDCTLEWDRDTRVFQNPCDGTTVSADGAGLVQYHVEVNEDGDLVIDLTAGAGGTSTP